MYNTLKSFQSLVMSTDAAATTSALGASHMTPFHAKSQALDLFVEIDASKAQIHAYNESLRLVVGSVLLDLHANEAADLQRLRVRDGACAVWLVVLQRGILQDGAIEDDGETGERPRQRTDAERDIEALLAVVDEGI